MESGRQGEVIWTPGRIGAAILVLVILVVSWKPGREVQAGEASIEAPERVVSADVFVRVVEPSGTLVVGAQVYVRFVGPSGSVGLEQLGTTADSGRALFAGFRARGAGMDGGDRFELGLVGQVDGGLSFRALSIPDRDLILVKRAESKQGLPAAVVLESVARDGVLAQVAEEQPQVEIFGKPDVPLGVEPRPLEVPDLTPRSNAPAPNEIAPKATPKLSLPSVAPDAQLVKRVTRGTPPSVTLKRGSLFGRIALEPGIPMAEVRIELDEVLPGNPNLRGRRLGPISPSKTGIFEFESVEAGLCAVRISLFGSQRTLAWVDNLEVKPGQILQDPRLIPFDLTGRLDSIEVQLFDGFGRALERGITAPLDLGSGAIGELRVQSHGSLPRLYFDRDVLRGGGLDLRLEAPFCGVRRVHISPADLSLGKPLAFVMEPARAAELELRLLGGLDSGFRVRGFLERADGQRRPWDPEFHQGDFDRAGRLRLQPAETGSFLVWIEVETDSVWRRLDMATAVEVEGFETAPAESEMGSAARDIKVLYLGWDPSSL